MENRRPPRSNSSGSKSGFNRPRGAPSFRSSDRGGTTSSNVGRPSNRPGDARRQAPGRPPDSRWKGERSDNRFGNPRGPGGRDPRGRDDRPRMRPDRRPEVEAIRITSDSQITDGRFRGRALVNSVSPYALRTNRKLRETVFNLIAKRIKAGRVLDLGAGSGTIGIEAISRGAMLATFVERSARMCSFIRKNLTQIGIKDGHAEVFEGEAISFLRKAGTRKRVWDVVYVDLPQCDEHTKILELLSRGYGIKLRGLVVVSHPVGSTCPETLNQLKRWRTIERGETILTIYERI